VLIGPALARDSTSNLRKTRTCHFPYRNDLIFKQRKPPISSAILNTSITSRAHRIWQGYCLSVGPGGIRTMNSRIRIIKRGAVSITNEPSDNQTEKTVCQRERETANRVKSWIAEWEERKRALDAAALSLVLRIN
jgi:hypothetical protein